MWKWVCLFGVIVASCGYPSLPRLTGEEPATDAAADADVVPPCPTCELLAIEPAIANAGDAITLEGTFVEPTLVQFPGGATQVATLLGPHRASVLVPVSATTGALSLASAPGSMVPFRRLSFPVGLQTFETNYDQAGGGRSPPKTASTRAFGTAHAIGSYVYVIGGFANGNLTNTVERALINADGSLGDFRTVPGVTLNIARQRHTSIAIGSYLYVIGGDIGDSPNETSVSVVERASIGPDGTLGAFAVVSGVTLQTSRDEFTVNVIGTYLYVIGGHNDGINPLASIERAAISPDGSLSAFATATDTALTVPRAFHGSLVAGKWIYVFSGGNDNGSLLTVEHATIAGDGTIGPFSVVDGITLPSMPGFIETAVIGRTLYLVGSGSKVIRTSINNDGTLSAFVTDPSASVTTVRDGAPVVTVGNYIYVIGGSDATLKHLATIERASFNDSGGLAPPIAFSAALATPLSNSTIASYGNHVYLIGGTQNGGRVNTIQQASVQPDGTLGRFALASNVMLSSVISLHTIATIGPYVYVIGGDLATGRTVQRLTVDDIGMLSSPTALPVNGLLTGRSQATCVVIGGFVYVIGGTGGSGYLSSIERASINTDGTIGAFVQNGTLATARTQHTSFVAGKFVYVVGGVGDAGRLDSVERATINADGSLSAFALLPSMHLFAPRSSHTMVVVGPTAYVLGGVGTGGFLSSAENATIDTTGTIGMFSAVIGVPFLTARARGASVVLGNFLYVLGGNNENDLSAIEQAELN